MMTSALACGAPLPRRMLNLSQPFPTRATRSTSMHTNSAICLCRTLSAGIHTTHAASALWGPHSLRVYIGAHTTRACATVWCSCAPHPPQTFYEGYVVRGCWRDLCLRCSQVGFELGHLSLQLQLAGPEPAGVSQGSESRVHSMASLNLRECHRCVTESRALPKASLSLKLEVSRALKLPTTLNLRARGSALSCGQQASSRAPASRLHYCCAQPLLHALNTPACLNALCVGPLPR